MTRHTEQTVYKCEFANGACVHCEATERGDCQGYVCDDSLYATYTKRPWQGLTPEEVKHLYPYGRSVWGKETYDAIEKALREKNDH